MSSSYDSLILGASPLAYWPLNETVGATAIDLSGHGHHGLYGGSCTLGQPGIGDGETAALFDGQTGHVTVPAAPAIQTFECCFRTTRSGSQVGALISQGASAAYPVAHGTGMIGAVTGGSGAQGVRETAATVTDGAWHHGAMVWPGGSQPPGLYVDGVTRTVVGATAHGTPIVGSAPMVIAAAPGGSSAFFGGEIAKAAAYAYALTPSQIAAHAAAMAPPPASSTTATITVTVDGSSVHMPVSIVGASPVVKPPGPITPPVIS